MNSTLMRGYLERITDATVSGWVQIPRANLNEGDFPTIKIFAKGELLAFGKAITTRRDVSNENSLGLGFLLDRSKNSRLAFSAIDIVATASLNENCVTLGVPKSLEIALEVGVLNSSSKRLLIENLSTESRKFLLEALSPEQEEAYGAVNRQKLCVVTYAQDAGAWFPYFYNYYSHLVGARSIYVVTPKPQRFSDYHLGGLISAENLHYDDVARAYFMSAIASGFHAYYEWSLVCDVDEFLIPYPNSGMNFLETLKACENDIVLARGFDVLQTEDEGDFHQECSILEQRRFAVPNTALSKPYLSRTKIRYSGGYHYCQKKLDFPRPGAGFICLHLKWACEAMRNEVALAVQGTTYVNQETASYAARSVALEMRHPLSNKVALARAVALDSCAVRDFEQAYYDNLTYSYSRGLWIGKHISADFVVDFRYSGQ